MSLIVVVPSLSMPPPLPLSAELPERVLPLIVSAPSFSTAPPAKEPMLSESVPPLIVSAA